VLPNLTYIGNPILQKKAAPVTAIDDTILEIIEELKQAIAVHSTTIALAAPQFGHSLSLFVARFPKIDPKTGASHTGEQYRVFINPKISDPSSETWVETEASYSIPGIRLPIRRPVSITVSYQDESGTPHSERLSGWPARIAMHENDLLNGTLFIFRADNREKKRIAKDIERLKEQHKEVTNS